MKKTRQDKLRSILKYILIALVILYVARVLYQSYRTVESYLTFDKEIIDVSTELENAMDNVITDATDSFDSVINDLDYISNEFESV